MLKLSNGFTNLFPSIGVVVAMGLSFYFLSLSLMKLPLGVAYAIWSGVGTALTALIGIVLWKEEFSLIKGIGLTLIIGGVIILNMPKEEKKQSC